MSCPSLFFVPIDVFLRKKCCQNNKFGALFYKMCYNNLLKAISKRPLLPPAYQRRDVRLKVRDLRFDLGPRLNIKKI